MPRTTTVWRDDGALIIEITYLPSEVARLHLAPPPSPDDAARLARAACCGHAVGAHYRLAGVAQTPCTVAGCPCPQLAPPPYTPAPPSPDYEARLDALAGIPLEAPTLPQGASPRVEAPQASGTGLEAAGGTRAGEVRHG